MTDPQQARHREKEMPGTQLQPQRIHPEQGIIKHAHQQVMRLLIRTRGRRAVAGDVADLRSHRFSPARGDEGDYVTFSVMRQYFFSKKILKKYFFLAIVDFIGNFRACLLLNCL